jgi:hypothetical protein
MAAEHERGPRSSPADPPLPAIDRGGREPEAGGLQARFLLLASEEVGEGLA